MLKLIYGTGNKGKLNLMREYLEGLDVVIEGLDQVDISFEEPEECGKDPLENARQKAEYYYSVLKRPVFSCDSGLYIEGLSDEEQPGVHVRNVNGRRLSDAEMTAHYSEIAHCLGGKCKAKYVNGICLVMSDTEKYESDGEEIGSEPFYLVDKAVVQRDEGFPLDPISIEPKSGRYFTECNDRGDFGPSRNGFRKFFTESCGLKEMAMRLYDKDAYIKEFEAVVLSCTEGKNGYEVILDQTAFFPEGGGQPADQGWLGDAKVTDTRDKKEYVVHICDKALETGSRVIGKIDWNRRFLHMQQHSGEHIFSGIIHRLTGFDNIGFHMGKDFVTVDFSGIVSEEVIAKAERMANEKVLENVEILAEYPSKEELETLEYRSKKEIEGDLRIVTIPGADVCACCGTHVERTGEIGPIKVTGSEHYKSGIRLTLKIGWEALEDYEKKHGNIRAISAMLSVPPEQTAEAVAKLQEQLLELKNMNVSLKQKIFEGIVKEIPEGSCLEIYFDNDLNAVEVRKLADLMASRTEFAAVFSGNDQSGYKYVMVSSKTDIAAFGKAFNQAMNGRGGGKSPMIQGSVQADEKSIREYFVNTEM